MKFLKLLKKLKDKNILQTLNEPITLKSGKKSLFYADFRKLYTEPLLLDEITDHLANIIEFNIINFNDKKGNFYLAGAPMGGIPLASIVANKLKLPFLLIRNFQKKHGTKKMIEGDLYNPNDNIIIIEDVITTGTSTYETYNKLIKVFPKSNVIDVVAIFDREETRVKEFNLKIHTLLNFFSL